ncbi:hypothetical protein GS501_00550 [Saccharibacter sp. 17.LH.SD]|uniref:hypothetical protein n=1 Tax=Saccharibacter sp. 17.LH.SD TaxID=2689393 RepID=UPI001372012D|nr:hypothetical protein [Saccharibacter sp. 17.LH.SD]MXV43568.1 hypothetical protein [Saccharibacter sp. 17.LH.SD]
MATKKLYMLQPFPVGRIIEFDLKTRTSKIIIDHMIGHPDGIYIDLDNRDLYWSNMGVVMNEGSQEFFQSDGSIEVSSLTGENRREIVGGGLFVTGKQLVADPASKHLYWCDREGMRVFRSDYDGGNVTVLVQRGLFPLESHDYTRHCVGIALDTKRGFLYWTQKGPPKGGKGCIMRANLAMPQGKTAKTRDDIVVLKDHLPEPIDLELDPSGDRLYWTDRGDDAHGGNSLNSAMISEDGLHDHKILARGLKEAIALSIDHDEGRVYLSDINGNLYQHDLAREGSLEKLAKFDSLTGIFFVTM